MKKNCHCNFLFGQLTDPETVRELNGALQAKSAIQKEIISYKKDGKCKVDDITRLSKVQLAFSC